MLNKLINPEIQDLLIKKNFAVLKEIVDELELADVAEIVADLPENLRAIFFRILHTNLAADVFEYIEPETQLEIIKSLSNAEAAKILNEMSPDDRTSFLEELPSSVTKKLIGLLNTEEREIALSLLAYPEYSVGRLLTTDFIAVTQDMTIAAAFDYIRKYGNDSETVNVIYVVNEQDILIDDIKIRTLIFANPNQKIEEILDKNYISLNVYDDQEKAIEYFKKYDRVALPVTDSAGVLLGMVTIDDVFDIAEEEATEDIHRFGGTEAIEEPYLNISLKRMIQKRAIWLSVLFLGELLTASVMAYFEEEISKAVVLALFVPLIISSGGNSGSQAATLVIRAMALHEISIKNWFFVLKREIMSGIILGSILGILGFLRVFIWGKYLGVYGEYWMLIGFTVSFALIGVVTWGTLMGGMLPILLKKIGLDPATSSAPFVATLVDVVGIIIYFSFAFFLLKGTLL
ncbi:MAG: magnesium transporter [Ignavibacteria bacterium]|nr:magnesium transporter [Ignavibacteria bacterium]